jgi:sterol 14-demethylase
MKIATLEMKMIVALFVLGYEYDVVDAKGKVLAKPPLVDYNAQLQVCFKLVLLNLYI